MTRSTQLFFLHIWRLELIEGRNSGNHEFGWNGNKHIKSKIVSDKTDALLETHKSLAKLSHLEVQSSDRS